ncbi:MAG: hypothetical protein MZV64_10115 [Ignavibacteriales bacterium]|nr:hypothetical protein [Ignavibacteriales bacterium]
MRYGMVETTWKFDDRKDSRLKTSEWIEWLYSDQDPDHWPNEDKFRNDTINQAKWLMTSKDAWNLLAMEAEHFQSNQKR